MKSEFNKIVDEIISTVKGLTHEEEKQFTETVSHMLHEELKSLTIEALNAPDTFPKSDIAVYAIDKAHSKLAVFDVNSFISFLDKKTLNPVREIPLWV